MKQYLMLKIFFIKTRNLAWTLWYLKLCLRTYGCIFFLFVIIDAFPEQGCYVY